MQSWHIFAVTALFAVFLGSCSATYGPQPSNWGNNNNGVGPNSWPQHQQSGWQQPQQGGWQQPPPQQPYSTYSSSPQGPPQGSPPSQTSYGGYGAPPATSATVASPPQPHPHSNNYPPQPVGSPQVIADETTIQDIEKQMNELPFYDMLPHQKLAVLALKDFLKKFVDSAKYMYFVSKDLIALIGKIKGSLPSDISGALGTYVKAYLIDGMGLPETLELWEASRQTSKTAPTPNPTPTAGYTAPYPSY